MGLAPQGIAEDQAEHRQRVESREIDYRYIQSKDIDIVRRKVYYKRLSSKILKESSFRYAQGATASRMAAGGAWGPSASPHISAQVRPKTNRALRRR